MKIVPNNRTLRVGTKFNYLGQDNEYWIITQIYQNIIKVESNITKISTSFYEEEILKELKSNLRKLL